MIFLLLSGSAADVTDIHNLTLVNNVKEVEIISLYIWGSDQSDKGNSWITAALQSDSSVSLSLPSGKCNILAFDELGNSYGIAGNYQKNAPDTIEIDLEHITFGRPNVDNGHYLLNLANSLNGFALDTLILSSARLYENIVIDDFRVFPGSSITIWLDKGIYSLSAIDQIGRTYSADSITVPDDRRVVSIVSGMIIDPAPPVGITGDGSVPFFIENCLPSASITGLSILPRNGADGIYLDSISLQPGAHIVVNLNPGSYSILAADEFNAEYFVSIEQQDAEMLRLAIVNDYLQHDFSFPPRRREQ
ncbi:MAG: hypothetical protein ABFR50_06440 [Candidatus Fermentibacteria bacterium]